MQDMVDKFTMHANNMPQWLMVALLLAVVLVLVKLVKSVFSSKPNKRSKLFQNLDSKQDPGSKGLSKKKRAKKQRSSEQVKRDEQNSEFDSITLTNPPTPTLENGEIRSIKKSEKRKNKSKKRKNQAEVEDISSLKIFHDSLEQEGEWHTVSTKEQRTVLKREKKKQDCNEHLNNVSFHQTKPSIFNPTYTSISSMAKEIAPRFARAAGEEWRENTSNKRFSNHQSQLKPSVSSPVVTRSPMTSSVSVQSQSTLNNWLPSSPIPDLWNSKAEKLSSSIIGLNSSSNAPWNPISTDIDGLTWNENVNQSTWPLNPNDISPASWVSSGSQCRDGSNWSPTDEWVHINFSNSIATTNEDWNAANLTRGLRRWSGIRTGGQSSPPVIAQAMIKREEFLLEPEGITVPDINDPWNGEIGMENDVSGDWSPPEATWSNNIEEWSAPAVETNKKQPVYFDESSGDEKRQTSYPVNNTNSTATPSGNTVVVGAGPEMLSSFNQTNNKKQRRRRRKKQLSQESINNDVTTKDNDEPEQKTVEPTEIENKNKFEIDLDANVEQEAWSVPKPSKKKKIRARKDD